MMAKLRRIEPTDLQLGAGMLFASGAAMSTRPLAGVLGAVAGAGLIALEVHDEH